METQKHQRLRVLPSKRMDGPHKKNATYADIEAVPEGKVGQLIDGDLYICGRPRVRHSLAITTLLSQLVPSSNDRSPKGWLFLLEVEIWFGKNGRNLFVPDIAGWRRSRLPDDIDVQSMEIVPDWVCEGLSPSTTRIDRGRKRELYAQYGVKHLWYADPKRREVEILALDKGSYRLAQIGTNDRGVFAPFTHEIDLARLWKP